MLIIPVVKTFHINKNHNLNTYQDTLVRFVAIVTYLFIVFDEISNFDCDNCDNLQVAPMVRSGTKNEPGRCQNIRA